MISKIIFLFIVSISISGCSPSDLLRLAKSGQSGGTQVDTTASIGDNKKFNRVGNDSRVDVDNARTVNINKKNIIETLVNNLFIIMIISVFLFAFVFYSGYRIRSPNDKKLIKEKEKALKAKEEFYLSFIDLIKPLLKEPNKSKNDA
jgi:hypothetical protein